MICATPRTGSTLLCELLASTEIAGKPRSYFRRGDLTHYASRWDVPVGPDGAFWYPNYVRAARRAGSTKNGVFGARVMWGTMVPLVQQLRTSEGWYDVPDREVLERSFGTIRFVHLSRVDELAQAVSWAKAELSEQWQDGDSIGSRREPRFSYELIDDLLVRIGRHNTAWNHWFEMQTVAPLRLTFESLVVDSDSAIQQVLHHLGLDPTAGSAVTSTSGRQSDHVNDDWHRRYQEIGVWPGRRVGSAPSPKVFPSAP